MLFDCLAVEKKWTRKKSKRNVICCFWFLTISKSLHKLTNWSMDMASSFVISLLNGLSLSLKSLHQFLWVRDLGVEWFLFFFFRFFFYFLLISDLLKRNAKWRRFRNSNGSTNWVVTKLWIDKNWKVRGLNWQNLKLEDWNEK